MKTMRRITALILTAIFILAGCATAADIYAPEKMISFGRHVYMLFGPACQWKEAEEYCRLIGGHLLTIESEGENIYITNELLKPYDTAAAMGFSDAGHEGQWVWVTGETGTYTNWAKNEPNNQNNENYGLILSDGTWNDGHLEKEKWPFICEFDEPPYEWSYGWRLTNGPQSFGYEANESISPLRYYQLYGINTSSLLESTLGNFRTGSSGLCFGLSLLSLAEYYGIYDISGYFSKSGNYLYDFGYDGVYTTSTGKEYFTIAGNEPARAVIERAFISQSSVEFSECQVFPSDPDFSGLLEFMSGRDARPLLVNLEDGLSGHTVVLTADYPPVQLNNGTYWLPVYDPNSPMPSAQLTDPCHYYKRGIAGLILDPENESWQLYGNKEVYMQNNFQAISLTGLFSGQTGHSIRYYDVAKLNRGYFTGPLNCWYDRNMLWIDGNDVELRHGDDTLLRIEGGELTNIMDGLNLILPFTEDTENTQSTGGTFVITGDIGQFEVISPSATILASGDNCLSAIQLDGSYTASLDLDAAAARADCISDGGQISLCVQNTATGKAGLMEGVSVAGESSSISVNENGGYAECAEGVNVVYDQAQAAAVLPPEKLSFGELAIIAFVITIPLSIVGALLMMLISRLRRRRTAQGSFCGSCGTPVAPGQKFCGICGQKLI